MIKKLLVKISKEIYHTEDRTSNFRKYGHMRKTDGWKVHQLYMATVANKMSEYLLSKEFTNLDMTDKDAQQRACHYTKEIIDFLFDPLKGITNYMKAEKMGATTGKPKRNP